jgi:hypothetical protein
VRARYTESALPSGTVAAHRIVGGRGLRMFVRDGCTIWIAREPEGGGPLRWHLSISRADRLPTWDEVRDARYALLPDEIVMVMVLPPRAAYVNAHEYCFHLWESLDPHLGGS